MIYTFEPDDGIEGVINLRGRIRDRLNQNSVVFGSDDKFFGDEIESAAIENFYTGNLEVLDELEAKGVEVDIVSEAHSRWLKAVENYPERTELIKKMPNLIYSSKTNPNDLSKVITYFQSNNKDIFISTTESHNPEILDYKRITPRAAMNIFECTPDEEGYKVGEKMIEIVKSAYLNIYKSSKEEFKGSLTGYRKKIYNLLKNNVDSLLLIDPDVKKYIQLIHDEPLTDYAKNYLKPYLQKPKPEDILSAIKQLMEMDQLVLNSGQKIDKTSNTFVTNMNQVINLKENIIGCLDNENFQELFINQLGWDVVRDKKKLIRLQTNYWKYYCSKMWVDVWKVETLNENFDKKVVMKFLKSKSTEYFILYIVNQIQEWEFPSTEEYTDTNIKKIS